MSNRPSPERLRKLLTYDPLTGKLFWKFRTLDLCKNSMAMKVFNTSYAGKEAFTASMYTAGKAYKCGGIFGKTYLAHRVIWAIVSGEWPKFDIDHIDGNSLNNCIENLRDVTHRINCQNLKLPADNASGHIGVSWNKDACKWVSYITANGERISLGYFEWKEEAIQARKLAEIRYWH